MNYQQLLATIALVLGVGGSATAISDALWADTLFCVQPDPKTGLTCDQLKNSPGIDVYYVVDQAHFNDDDLFGASHQDPATVRWNADHTQFILKYNGVAVPRGQVGAQLGLNGAKSHEEILQILDTTAWRIEDPNDPTVKKGGGRTFVEDDVGRE